jgi:hypothetical protein
MRIAKPDRQLKAQENGDMINVYGLGGVLGNILRKEDVTIWRRNGYY